MGGTMIKEAIEFDRMEQNRMENDSDINQALKQEIVRCFPNTPATEFWNQFLQNQGGKGEKRENTRRLILAGLNLDAGKGRKG